MERSWFHFQTNLTHAFYLVWWDHLPHRCLNLFLLIVCSLERSLRESKAVPWLSSWNSDVGIEDFLQHTYTIPTVRVLLRCMKSGFPFRSLQQLINSCHSYAKWHFSSLTICSTGKWHLPLSHCQCQNLLLSACTLLCDYSTKSLCGPSLPDSFCFPCIEQILDLVKYHIILSQKPTKKILQLIL